MSNQSKVKGDDNIIIQGVDMNNSTITVNVNNETKEIKQNISELKALMEKYQKSLEFRDTIYSIGEIGKTEFQSIINYYQESKTSRYLKIFTYIIIPILAISVAYLLYWNWVNQQPLSLTVQIQNINQNPELPFEKGKVILRYADKTEVIEIKGLKDITFKAIPSNLRNEKINFTFEAQGFEKIDTLFLLSDNSFSLLIKRDDTYAKITGFIKDNAGNPLEKVSISTLDLKVFTDKRGYFELQIPFEKQRKKQRISIFKEGYKAQDFETPVIKEEELRVVLVGG